MKIFLLLCLILLLWFTFGFIAFLIEAKVENYTSFNREARVEFKYCLGFGLFSLFVMLSEVIYNWFCNTFMDGLLFRLNNKNKQKKKLDK